MAKTHLHTVGSGKTPEYQSWCNMNQRCNNPNDPKFADYGGRGIKVCERWTDFSIFLADMGMRPEGTTIDRIDADKGYSPENCRWATKRQQQNNRRANVFIEIDGETLTLAEWSLRLGRNYKTVQARIKRGWNPVKALKKPNKWDRNDLTNKESE